MYALEVIYISYTHIVKYTMATYASLPILCFVMSCWYPGMGYGRSTYTTEIENTTKQSSFGERGMMLGKPVVKYLPAIR